MRKWIAVGMVLALALAAGAQQASAEVKVRFELENSETGEKGAHISARAGDKLVLKLFVKNEELADAVITTDLTAAIPGCVVQAQDVDDYKQKRNKKFTEVQVVPNDLPAGTVLTLDAEAQSSLGNFGSASGSVTLVVSKASGGTAARGGIFQRIFLQAVAHAILASDDTEAAAQADFSAVKMMFR